jgi:DNA-binding Lrp family transcriptional regulator
VFNPVAEIPSIILWGHVEVSFKCIRRGLLLSSLAGESTVHKPFDMVDLKVLEALAVYGPRNVTAVSRRLHMPAETLRKKLRRLNSQTFLRFNVNICDANLGLVKAVVFAEAVPGYESALLDALKINDFWVFLSRCYGVFEGCVGIFDVPYRSRDLFEHFISELERTGLSRRCRIFWSTCFFSTQSRNRWFNPETNAWDFDWDGWLQEIKTESRDLPCALVEPEAFPVKADETDVFILKELEKDAIISFRRLAKRLSLSPQLVRYHYYNHILGKELLEGFEVTAFYFGKDSEFSLFTFSFDEEEKLARFASSLLDKPFVKAVGKILGENQLFGYLCFPRSELRRFLEILSGLVRSSFLKDYQYVIQDSASSIRESIPYQCFKEGRWVYNHERHINILNKFLQNTPLAESAAALRPASTLREDTTSSPHDDHNTILNRAS